MGQLARALLGAMAAIGLVAIGFGLGSQTAVAQPAQQHGDGHESIEAMVDDCSRHMQEMAPAMENMMGSEGMDAMMGSGRMMDART